MPNDIQEVAEKVVKKRSRPDRHEAMSIHADPTENTLYLEHSRAIARLSDNDVDMTSVPQVNQRISDYFDVCSDNGMKPTCAGFALAFGVDRRTMIRWVGGENKGMPASVVARLKKAYALINMQMEDYMQNGKINPVAGIFLMKNNMGYTDKTEVVIEPGDQVQDEKSLLEESELLPGD